MKQDWKMVKLGKVIKRANRFEKKSPFETYSFSGTYSYAKGIFKSYEKNGSEFNLDKIQRIKEGDFIFCKIMAWEGAFGLAPKECDDTVMSGAFVAYEINKEQLVPEFLDNYFKIERVWREAGGKSSGTNVRRKTLYPEDFEAYEIPLPPLSEQQRIAGRLAALKGKIDAVRRLRGEQEKEMKGLKNAIYLKAENDVEPKPLGDFLKKSESRIEPMMGTAYRQVGVKWWGEGAYERETIDGGQTAYKSFCRLELNDFIFNKIWVRHGALAIVKENTVGCYAPGEFPVFKCKSDFLAPQWLDFIINSPLFWEKCAALSKGTSGKNRINPEQLLGIKIPVPSISEQERLITMFQKIEAVKAGQASQLSALDGMFPGVLEQAFRGEW